MGGVWRSLVPVNALVFAALLVGLVSNVLIAATFGLTHRVDAFYAAMMLPSLFMILCVDYLGKNFLPVFAVAKREGEAIAASMTSTIVTVVLLGAAAVTILLVAFSVPLFTLLLPGFEAAEIDLVARYFAIMAPAIVLMAVNTFHEYVCQYDEKFVQIVAIRMALPGMNLATLLLLAPFVGEYSLPLGYLAGHVIVFVLMAREARYHYRPQIRIRPDLEKKVFKNSAIVMSTGLVARTKSIVVNALASSLGGGAISALAFAMKLTEPLERGAFAGARMFMFSRTARLFADRNHHAVGQLYAMGLRVSFLLLVPVLAWIAMNSGAIVEVLFARGQFTPEMTTLVAATLLALVPTVLFAGVGQLLTNAFYAMGRVKVPALIMPAAMLVFVAAAVPLARVLGTQGIALATTTASLFAFCTLLVYLARGVRELPLGSVAFDLVGYTTFGVVVMGAVVAILRAFAPPVVAMVASLPVGLAIYFGLLAAAQNPTWKALWRFAGECFRAEPAIAVSSRSNTVPLAPTTDSRQRQRR
jgi:putative peptidoglycan lipid II flippase